MTKYEYKVETLLLNDEPDTKRIEQLTEEGWELVSVVGGQRGYYFCAQVATSFFYRRAL